MVDRLRQGQDQRMDPSLCMAGLYPALNRTHMSQFQHPSLIQNHPSRQRKSNRPGRLPRFMAGHLRLGRGSE